VRYVTNEQRRRRTLFKPTLWAVASWLIFCVAHSLRPAPFLRPWERSRSFGVRKWCGMLVVRALKISQLTDGGMPPTYDSMHEPEISPAGAPPWSRCRS
jgi:hypothetical protein